MIEFEFCGYASLPGNPMGECLDAAGIDASLEAAGPSDADDTVAPMR